MELRSKSGFQFFPWGYAREIFIKSRLSDSQFLNLIDQIVTSLIRDLDQPLINKKGRDIGHLLSENIEIGQRPNGDELFFLSGMAVEALEEEPELTAEEDSAIQIPDFEGLERSPFEIRINTVFDSFGPQGNILYKIKQERTGAIPEDLNFFDLGRSALLFPEYLRYGCNIFSKKFFQSALGLVPTVTDILLIEATKYEIKVAVFSDSMPKREIPSLRQEEFGEEFVRIWDAIFGSEEAQRIAQALTTK